MALHMISLDDIFLGIGMPLFKELILKFPDRNPFSTGIPSLFWPCRILDPSLQASSGAHYSTEKLERIECG